MLEALGRTDTGRVRERNEDVFAVRPDIGLCVLADGMGGTNAGDVAATLAVDSVMATLSTREIAALSHHDLKGAMEQANAKVFDESVKEPELHGMGTTMVIAAVQGTKVVFCHVGDSRGYLYRNDSLEQVTTDHSVVQQLVEEGILTKEEARLAPNRNIITRAIGAEPTVVADVVERDLEDGDVLLLCSDGLSDLLSPTEIESIVRDHAEDLASAATQLVDAANDAGGTDNVTVVLSEYRQ